MACASINDICLFLIHIEYVMSLKYSFKHVQSSNLHANEEITSVHINALKRSTFWKAGKVDVNLHLDISALKRFSFLEGPKSGC